MRKIIFCSLLLLLFLHYITNPINAQNNKENVADSLFLAVIEVIEDYYSYYYHYPGSTKQVFEFVEAVIYANKNNLMYLAPYSFDNYYVIEKTFKAGLGSLSRKDEYINVCYGEIDIKIPIEHLRIQVCEIDSFIGSFPSEYNSLLRRFSRGRFFDLNGKAIIVNEILNTQLRDLISLNQEEYLTLNSFGFRKYKYDDVEVPIKVVFSYDFQKGLKYYCSEKTLDANLLFYKKLECSLYKFCKINNLSKLFFLMPDYYYLLE